MEEKEQKKSKMSLKQFLSGDILTQDYIKKYFWHILFLVFLSIVYINNKYKTESILIEIIRLQKEVKDLRDRSVSYAAELMSISRESEVVKLVKEKQIGIEELKMPPEKIVVTKE